jgi:hypothetical protein
MGDKHTHKTHIECLRAAYLYGCARAAAELDFSAFCAEMLHITTINNMHLAATLLNPGRHRNGLSFILGMNCAQKMI